MSPAHGGRSPVLVLTDLIDPTADLVSAELARRGVPAFRCNPGDFPQRLTMHAVVDGDGLAGRLSAVDRRTGVRRDIDLSTIGCAYYRRPTAFRIPDCVPAEWVLWASREARQGFGGVVSAIRRWLNHPADIAYAEYKPVQLCRAAECGLAIPRTVVTNSRSEAHEFAAAVGRVVQKRLSATPGPGDPFTHLADPADMEVSDTAHMFQEFVDKVYDVRVIVVDDVVFPVRIDLDADTDLIDWRAAYGSHRYEVVELPSAVRHSVMRLLQCFRLRFAAFDFGVVRDGRWIFFELNPNGQWAWLQEGVGLPIAAAVADALCDEPDTHRLSLEPQWPRSARSPRSNRRRPEGIQRDIQPTA